MIPRSLSAAAAAVALLFCSASVTSAQDLSAVTFTGGNTSVLSNTTVGWEFTVTAPLLLTGLSYYDHGADGLAIGHRVGLWNTVTGVLLADATITNASPLLDSFRVERLGVADQVLLVPGITYTVGGFSGATSDPSENDPFVFLVQNFNTTPGITFGRAVLNSSGTFAIPNVDQSLLNPGLFGGSFTVVPEPGTYALLGVGLLCGAGGALRRRLRQS